MRKKKICFNLQSESGKEPAEPRRQGFALARNLTVTDLVDSSGRDNKTYL